MKYYEKQIPFIFIAALIGPTILTFANLIGADILFDGFFGIYDNNLFQSSVTKLGWLFGVLGTVASLVWSLVLVLINLNAFRRLFILPIAAMLTIILAWTIVYVSMVAMLHIDIMNGI